ncbi:MAG: hypothetical protein QXV17_10460 [Candidatus Micrarchaeaceae archaeon]
MAKYPSPDVARRRFETGVEQAREKWALRAREGATDYQTWFTGFANTIYPIVASLPSKEGKTLETIVAERVTPIARAVKNLSTTYRASKLSEIARKVAVVVRA